MWRRSGTLVLFLWFLSGHALQAQDNSEIAQTQQAPLAQLQIEQVSDLLGLTPALKRLQSLQGKETCESKAGSLEELTLRQFVLESVQAASLDVDSAMGVIANERGTLSNLQTSLKASRDKTVARLNAAALITGSGIGAAVSATQFTTVGAKANNVGDGIGIGSGIASTVLAYLAVRKQHGPEGHVLDVTNMLAPLFDRPPVLNTFYPPVVLEYLQLVPPGPSASRGSRLEQLKTEWIASGRLNSSDDTKDQMKIVALTSGGGESRVKVSIDDLTDRIAMLGDVSGRIALMKRDLSLVMRFGVTRSTCPVQ
jgi:hypothetical protein